MMLYRNQYNNRMWAGGSLSESNSLYTPASGVLVQLLDISDEYSMEYDLFGKVLIPHILRYLNTVDLCEIKPRRGLI